MSTTLSIKQVELLFDSYKQKNLPLYDSKSENKNMEHVGAISEGEWNSFNGMCSEEAEFMAQLLGNCSLPTEVTSDTNFPVSSTFWPSHESNKNIAGVDDSAMYSSDESSFLLPFSTHESYFPSFSHQVFLTNNNLMMMDYCMMGDTNDSSRDHILSSDVMGVDDKILNQDVSNDSVEPNKKMSEDVLQGKNLEYNCPSESKKRSRIPGEVQRNKRSVKLNKRPKVDESDEDNNNKKNALFHRQNTSSCCSEDDSNASHELNGVASSSSSKGGGALNLNGKTRANRGSATDPQSLYARKRRERINERLRILQKLVPNGTKVDISTMLEEAVQYVKFLQLQIKLLSSDDLWMYAPIAYNGMDIGLDLKMSTPKPQSS